MNFSTSKKNKVKVEFSLQLIAIDLKLNKMSTIIFKKEKKYYLNFFTYFY